MNPTDCPVANPDIVLREEFDDWAILFHPLTNETVGIGPVAVMIWKLLDGQRTVAQVADEVKAQCSDAPDTVLDDTLEFVNDLERRLLLRGPEDE